MLCKQQVPRCLNFRLSVVAVLNIAVYRAFQGKQVLVVTRHGARTPASAKACWYHYKDAVVWNCTGAEQLMAPALASSSSSSGTSSLSNSSNSSSSSGAEAPPLLFKKVRCTHCTSAATAHCRLALVSRCCEHCSCASVRQCSSCSGLRNCCEMARIHAQMLSSDAPMLETNDAAHAVKSLAATTAASAATTVSCTAAAVQQTRC